MLGVAASRAEPPTPAGAPTFAHDVAPLFAGFCAPCHGGASKVAPDLRVLADEASVSAHADAWQRAVARVRAGTMPPKGALAPPRAAVARLAAWAEATWPAPAVAPGPAFPGDPGRVTMRRLNRTEYHRSVADLLGVDERESERFPADDVGAGFDRTGDVLATTPLLVERWAEAAARIAEQAVVVEDGARPAVRRFEAEAMACSLKDSARGGVRVLYTNGEVRADVALPRDGEYLVRARVAAQQAGPEPAQVLLAFDGKGARLADVKAEEPAFEVVEARVQAGAGSRRVVAAFPNDFWDPKHADPKRRDRNLVVDWVEVVGPVDAPPPPPASHVRIFRDDPGGDDVARRARRVVGPLATRAFRRPLAPGELDPLVALVTEAVADGEPFAQGVRYAVEAILSSPRFLFHVEALARPDDPTAVVALDDFAYAARLASFLWSSLPDAELTAAATRGGLAADPAAQVRRMLADPRASALSDGFAEQWLTLRRLASAAPDPARFPTVDARLREDMRRETLMVFSTFVAEDRSVLELADARWTWLNDRLARHYGIEGVEGDWFRRVPLDGTTRGGILTHASVLLVTSYPTRTSSVKRGKWLLEQVLGQSVPPPPPGAGDLPDTPDARRAATVRERLERHRRDPACAACHVRMDPLGFALEGYDAVGAWRTLDDGRPVDTAGALPDGRAVDGPAALRALVRADPGFPRGFAAQLLTYALGRSLSDADAGFVDAIVERARAREYRVSAFVEGVAASDPFRRARGDASRAGASR